MKATNITAPGGLYAALTVLAVLVALPAAASAQERDHEGGFFLRLSAGPGSASTEVDVPPMGFMTGTTMKFSGPTGDLNFAVGGIVASNLALHGTLFGWTISNPDIEIGGGSSTATGDLTLAGIGGGVTYYFMPVNIYISGSVGVGKIEYTQEDLTGRSSSGLMFDATVGKEWWVGDSWGLGVALGCNLHSIPDEGTEDNWSGGSVAIRFTATMN